MPVFVASRPCAPTSPLRRRVSRVATAALGLLILAGPAQALPTANVDRADVAPKPLLSKPVPAPAPAALPDTSALLPAGEYVLRLTLKGETLAQPVKVGRTGGHVSAVVGGSETLRGTLDAAGRLQLAGGNATDRLELGATVANRRASGQAQLGRGANRMNGSFTLDPAVQGAKKMKEYQAPGTAAAECGFFCKLGKAWDGLTKWAG